MQPEVMLNIGSSLVFLAVIFALILIPLFIVEKIVQIRSEKRCSATANGTYAGTRVVQTSSASQRRRGKGTAPLVYDQARFFANGEERVVDVRSIYGITMKTEVGEPLVVHYDPDNPAYCWAHTPSAKAGPSTSVKVFLWLTIGSLAVGMLLIRLS